MGELVNRGESAIVPEGFYKQVSSILNAARDKAYTAVNFAMVEALLGNQARVLLMNRVERSAQHMERH